ncbi:regulatory protein GemA [Methylobacterium radiotolerans]|uniref:regulatory protein GemA n=1 Tax=Methylobacterium radiotolerans TaxID=31998 RepID=UPI001F34374D|nr:regulatory protein GemA [Methylobacterium radiotolerans]UIY44117.1 regulatory protein GemA [Methylobacterium radiotolerans]
MSLRTITPEQIRTIHAIKTRTKLNEMSYRAMLSAYGVPSSKDLSREDADRLIIRMRDIPGASTPVQRAKASGKYATKLQAMWLALYNLGAVVDRRDGAMHAFLERQTGVQHTRFLQQASEAHKAIEALKAWMVREGVVWPVMTGDPGIDRMAMKRAVLRAQWQRLTALGAVRAFGDPAECDGLAEYVSAVAFGSPRRISSLDAPILEASHLDGAAVALGRKIRKAQAPATEALRGAS